MSRASRVRRVAAIAMYGGGGLGALAGGLYGLLAAEARLARRTIGQPFEQPPDADGRYGAGDGEPLRLAMLGDSSAGGLGVDAPHETPGAMLAAGLAELAGRPVEMRSFAVVGAQSDHLEPQVDGAVAFAPHVAVVMVGANDVTHRIPGGVSVRHLGTAVRRLRDAGAEVVVGTCPDLGTLEPVPQPLRWIARRRSRQLAAVQTVATVEAGGRSVSLGDLLGPEFAAAPKEMFSADRFHPSAAGYASATVALLPSVCASLGLWPEDREPEPDARRGEGVLPVAEAAVEAADVPGTEVAATQVSGAERGLRGRWALLRRRPRRALPDVEAIAEPGPSAT